MQNKFKVQLKHLREREEDLSNDVSEKPDFDRNGFPADRTGGFSGRWWR
jgi:hypothetical protein